MNVFNLRDQLVADYSEYVRSYIAIRDERISKHVAQRLDEGMLSSKASSSCQRNLRNDWPIPQNLLFCASELKVQQPA